MHEAGTATLSSICRICRDFSCAGVDASHQPARPDAQVPSPVDPDRDQRIPSGLGGNAGANVGSVQLSATAMPRTPFTTYPGGEHDHRINFELVASRDVGDQLNTVAHPSLYADRNVWPNTTVDGRHAHKIEAAIKKLALLTPTSIGSYVIDDPLAVMFTPQARAPIPVRAN
jgi:hypothetical protein